MTRSHVHFAHSFIRHIFLSLSHVSEISLSSITYSLYMVYILSAMWCYSNSIQRAGGISMIYHKTVITRPSSSKNAYFRLSVCPSVRLSHLFDNVPVILKFSGVITIDRHDVHAKRQGQKSKVRVTEVLTPFSRFRTITPVWIHMWWWNDAQS